jgi:cytoskeletal protein CcmA (bactofilin family)
MALFSKRNNTQPIPNHKTTIIAEGSRIKGGLDLLCELFVDGEIEGVITSVHEVTVGTNGRIVGDIKAEKVVIHGKVEGNIDADKVYIQSEGNVSGTIESHELIIEPKGIFQGESKIKIVALNNEKPAKKDDKS